MGVAQESSESLDRTLTVTRKRSWSSASLQSNELSEGGSRTLVIELPPKSSSVRFSQSRKVYNTLNGVAGLHGKSRGAYDVTDLCLLLNEEKALDPLYGQ